MSYSDWEAARDLDLADAMLRWDEKRRDRIRKEFIHMLDQDDKKKCVFFDLIIGSVSDNVFEKARERYDELERTQNNTTELKTVLESTYEKRSDMWAYQKMIEGYRIINEDNTVCEAEVLDDNTVDIDVYVYKDGRHWRHGITGIAFLSHVSIKSRNNWKLLSIKKHSIDKTEKKNYVDIDDSYENIELINKLCRYK